MTLRVMDKIRLKARTRLIVSQPKTGKVVKIIKGRNLIVTVGKAFVGDMLIDADADHDTGLLKCAIGTGTPAPEAGDTQLVTEVARKTITSRTRTGNEVTLSTFWSAADCAYDLKEAGTFGSALATQTPNSGKLFSRWLAAFDNSAGNYDLTYEHIITIG